MNGKLNALFAYEPSHEVLDAVNLRLLAVLRDDPRSALASLARQIGMSSPAVAERLRRMEEAGIIVGYRVEIAPKALGLPVGVYVRVRPNPGQLPKIAALAQNIPEVVECHRITGDDCFILKAYLPAIEQLDRLLTYGTTTTSIIQSSPVPLRPSPLPEKQ